MRSGVARIGARSTRPRRRVQDAESVSGVWNAEYMESVISSPAESRAEARPKTILVFLCIMVADLSRFQSDFLC